MHLVFAGGIGFDTDFAGPAFETVRHRKPLQQFAGTAAAWL
ncbi:Uncharacterized protein ToN1_50320 [Aromatoleum petrolei]|nr:Uncharacterized protein ToN1_50320 [Aromatoleum petrolei]